MVGRGSPKINLFLSKAGHVRNSPKSFPPKKHGSSPKAEKSRAFWNPGLEKCLVELLHEHNTPDYRGQTGWTTEAWNKIVKNFHHKNDYVTFSKSQIQDKEKELKREYRLLKEARKQSETGWNEQRGMIEGDSGLWSNLVTSNPKLKKFRNKSFPLFDALGELYDGYTAEGTYNFTSTQSQHAVLMQVDNPEELSHTKVIFPDLEETVAYNVQEDAYARLHTNEDEVASVQRNEEKMNKRPSTSTTKREEKETKKPKKDANVIAGCMERYIDMREKQFEIESAQLASEKESAKDGDFSIRKCIYVLKSMELTKEKKEKAFEVFKNADKREIFLTCSEDDEETSLIWLRNAMANLL